MNIDFFFFLNLLFDVVFLISYMFYCLCNLPHCSYCVFMIFIVQNVLISCSHIPLNPGQTNLFTWDFSLMRLSNFITKLSMVMVTNCILFFIVHENPFAHPQVRQSMPSAPLQLSRDSTHTSIYVLDCLKKYGEIYGIYAPQK